MNLSEIKLDELDIDDLKKIGSAPLPVEIAIIIALCAPSSGVMTLDGRDFR